MVESCSSKHTSKHTIVAERVQQLSSGVQRLVEEKLKVTLERPPAPPSPVPEASETTEFAQASPTTRGLTAAGNTGTSAASGAPALARSTASVLHDPMISFHLSQAPGALAALYRLSQLGTVRRVSLQRKQVVT